MLPVLLFPGIQLPVSYKKYKSKSVKLRGTASRICTTSSLEELAALHFSPVTSNSLRASSPNLRPAIALARLKRKCQRLSKHQLMFAAAYDV